jgi:hypothetical protein
MVVAIALLRLTHPCGLPAALAATGTDASTWAWLPMVIASPATPRPGHWYGQGCASPGGPCNWVGFTLAPDATSLSDGFVQAGRDRMTCQSALIVGGTFTMYCSVDSVVTGRFFSPTEAGGHYVANWYGVFFEAADWAGS